MPFHKVSAREILLSQRMMALFNINANYIFFDGQLWRVEMFDMTQSMMKTMSWELNLHLVLKVVLV